MKLPGGPADTAGNRYEHWWALAECVRLLHGATETLRIETLGGRAGGARRDRGHAAGGSPRAARTPGGAWRLTALDAGTGRLLQAAGDRMAGNDDRFVLVSDSDARELSEPCEAARDAGSAKAFEHAG